MFVSLTANEAFKLFYLPALSMFTFYQLGKDSTKLMKADINNCASYVNTDRGSSYEHVQVDG